MTKGRHRATPQRDTRRLIHKIQGFMNLITHTRHRKKNR